MEAQKELKKEVSDKYQMLGNHGVGQYYFKGRSVQLDQIDLATADKLVKQGFPYLVPASPKLKPLDIAAKP